MYIGRQGHAPALTASLLGRSLATKLGPRSAPNSNTPTIVTLAIVIVIVVIIIAGYSAIRILQRRGKDSKMTGSFFKRTWGSLTPGSKYRQVNPNGRGSQELAGSHAGSASSGNMEVEERAASQAVAAGVDRTTSVRSVMTLPAYQQSPKEGEQVLGREGERAGMDTVVEFPETHEEEEARREDQMESLYQIRLARRREIAEREERRRERQEARSRGDMARLEELRRESRARAAAAAAAAGSTASSSNSAENLNAGLSASTATLIAEHQSRGRDRRVSAVAYADVGHVRHDGTRLRANSTESEHGALLAGAAPMGEHIGRPRGASDAASFLSQPQPPFRERSGSSALSISTTASDLDNVPAPNTRVLEQAAAAEPNVPPRSSDSNTTSVSSVPVIRLTPQSSASSEGPADVGELGQPVTTTTTLASSITTTTDATEDRQSDVPQPPDYDQLDWGHAPAYTEGQASAAVRRSASNASQRAFDDFVRLSQAPQVPQLRLPSIHIQDATEPNTPASPSLSFFSRDPDRRRRSRHGNRDEDWDEA